MDANKLSKTQVTTSNRTSPLIQPKLSFIVKKIINSLGYGIQNDVFESGFLQYLHILNEKKQ
jgi:hypothetical protein